MKTTADQLRMRKGNGLKIVMLTCYDCPTARIENRAGIDVLLVGDSVGTNVLGYSGVWEVTMNDMVHHVRAVSRGAGDSFVLCDMPYNSFSTPESALENARRLIEAGADGVKMEGEEETLVQLKYVASNGIAVCGHIGYTPQTDGARASVQGKDARRATNLAGMAKEIEQAGAFMLVLELIPEELSRFITSRVSIPTIGIGAGCFCDGQVQVVYDIAGMSEKVFRHSKAFGSMGNDYFSLLSRYAKEVREGAFPGENNSSKLPEGILEQIEAELTGRE